MNQLNRVVVTGMSVCAPNGVGIHAFEKNILKGVSGCDYINHFAIPEGFGKTAGIIKDFHPDTLFKENKTPHLKHDRLNLLASFCIDEILGNANLSKKDKSNVALYISSAIGPMASMENIFIQKNIFNKKIAKRSLSRFSFSAITNDLVKKFSFKGGSIVIPTGCVGGCDAISYATNAIRTGKVERVIVGAVEAPVTPLVIASFGRIHANSTRACDPKESSCPFDERRDGFVLAEGAGFLMLESESAAKKRSANILGEVKGVASVNNCFHMTDILSDGKSISLSCELALKDANLNKTDISYINAHGSSTPQNDIAESNAFLDLFGKTLASKIPVTSLKSQIGHALSAANAIEIVSSLLSLKNKKIPPTINLKNKDPKCPVYVAANDPLSMNIKNVLKTSSGFSGIHTAVIVGNHHEYK